VGREPLSGPSADEVWLDRTPEKMAAEALASFAPRLGRRDAGAVASMVAEHFRRYLGFPE